MSNIVRFNIEANPIDGQFLEWDIDVSGLLTTSQTVTFVDTITDASVQCLIGATKADTSDNLIDYLTNYVTVVQPSLDTYSTITSFNDGTIYSVELEVLYNKTARFKFEFYGNPALNTRIALDLKKNGSVYENIDKTLAGFNSLAFLERGTTSDITANNLLTNLNAHNPGADTTYSISTGVNGFGYKDVYVDINGTVDDVFSIQIFTNTTSAINTYPFFDLPDTEEVVEYTITLDDAIALYNVSDLRVRSPHLEIASSTTAFDSTTFKIKFFEGDINTEATQPLNKTVSKSKLRVDQTNIYIDINTLINEKMELDVTKYLSVSYLTASQLTAKESKWVNVDVENYFKGTLSSNYRKFYFILDGYLAPTEVQGSKNLLVTGTKRYVDRFSPNRLYFKTYNLDSVTYITDLNSTPQVVTYSTNSEINIDYVNSLTVFTDTSIKWVKYTFTYDGVSEDFTYFYSDECKYDLYTLVFKNKWGVGDAISMSKKSIRSLKTEGNTYQRNIVDMNGSYNSNRHTTKQFNVNGYEDLTLNTDYIPEYMNDVFKEAMLTEECWLIDANDNIIPVVKQRETLDFKTVKNDKLVQYTFSVKKSHNEVKNIK